MSELSGILSLLLILAAFMTSCNPQPQGDIKPIAPLSAQ